MKLLYLITARGGSKGLPGKNIRLLEGKPLIQYSIEFARRFAPDADICVSTDDQDIASVVKATGLKLPFQRPGDLATDVAGSREVMLHALEHYEKTGSRYDAIVLLQPTSPFRSSRHLSEMLNLFDLSIDMVVSVQESHYNPYFSLFEENKNGFLEPSKGSGFTRRQDCPRVYGYNGSLYIINARSLRAQPLRDFKKIRKYEMDRVHSIDIDDQVDWWIAEMAIEKGLWKGD